MANEVMQAIRVHQYGEPEQLQLEVVPRPVPKEGEALVKIHATGVLPIEWKIRSGTFRNYMPATFPYIPGSAFAGIVEQVGSGVTTFQKGQAVFGRTNNGGYAEYTIVATETLALKPEALSFAEAASISGGATVAWTALFECAELQAGQSILIHGAAGGVGAFAVQFARDRGAHVIGTASSANQAFVAALGAERVIDYATTPFEQVVRDVDVVLDTIGGDVLRRSMQIVKPGGIVVSLLEEPSQDQARALRIRAMKNTASLPFPSTQLLQTIAHLIDEGQVKATIAHIFPLREASLAHALSQNGHGHGRIVLHVAD
ncbi:NADPH:quinone reductase [Reticulibacter mediterranei]|uniref:NADPH:quinone reductase n=1 Tax=Reticulibacter mediterranei TaxID=2778369 RepID=A0A8J3ILW2_9CHLR|nr:NADP-dependent oxidoreductase [Reticulibacter mediterranei]GHO96926.1 NADPH:quinone reductase [Reticulibacter mediterranei]